MKINLLPKNEDFFKLFNEQAELISKGAILLKEFMENIETDSSNAKLHELIAIEHKGDDIVHDVSVKLNSCFITPIDREDIKQLTSYLDDVLDYIHSSAMRMHYFKVKKPTTKALELADIIIKSTKLIKEGIAKLPRCIESECAKISELRKEMLKLEREADDVNRSGIGDLFEKNGHDFLYVIKWKDIYSSLETATDKCEDVFDILEGVMLKNA